MIPADRYPPAPEGFRERFIDPTPRGGWRGVERAYGARREVIQRWIAECGGPIQLANARKQAMIRLKDEIRQAKAIQSMRIRATLSRGRTMGIIPE